MPINAQLTGRVGRDNPDFGKVLRDCLDCGVILVNSRKKIAGFNARVESLTGLRAAQVLDQPVKCLPPALCELIDHTFASGKPVANRQVSLAHPTRGSLTLHVGASFTGPGNDSKPHGVVLVLHEVSAIGKWQTNLQRLDQLHGLSTFSAGMAHEAKNAFVTIKTFIDLLLEKNPGDELAQLVRSEMLRIDSLLGQMRRFAGPSKPVFAPLHLHASLEKSLQLILPFVEEKQIQLTRSLAAAPDLLKGDPDQLEQAFINLLFNALDALKPGGHLTVSTELLPAGSKAVSPAREKNKPWLRVLIQDDGIGIAPENMDRLFEPFFTTKPDGTGLGLAITKRIVQDHGGFISVDSTRNQGTTFTLLLPPGG